jgi:hypothetical protein
MDHSASSGGEHTGRHGNAHERHGNRGNGRGNTNVATGGGSGPRAAGGDEFALSDGQAILVSLGTCLLLGIGGGWMIRTTQRPRRTA